MKPLISSIVLSLLLLTAPLGAAVIHQDDNHYLAFETETAFTSNDLASAPWTIINDTGASGGKALLASGKSSPRGAATYQLQFTHAGTYYLYIHLRTQEKWDPDSHDAFRTYWKAGEDADQVLLYVDGALANQSYLWLNVPKTFVDVGIPATYTVAQEDVDQIIPFMLEISDTDVIIDRVIFDSSSRLSDSALAGLSNSSVQTPEPAAALALGAFLLAVALRRPRGG